MSTLKGKSISSTYKNLIQTSAEITDTNLRSVETGAGNSVAMNLSTDKAEFLKVGIGTGGLTPDGLLHVMSVSAGSVTSNTSANLLTLENSSDSGLSILSGSSSSGNIFFGDADDNDVGLITYNHSTNSMFFGTNGANTMKLDQSGNLNISGVLNQAEDRYFLDEYFHKLPYKDIQDAEVTQPSSATNAVTSHTKNTRITTVANDLAANDSQEFTFNNDMIHTKSYVHAVLVDTSATVADNAAIVVLPKLLELPEAVILALLVIAPLLIVPMFDKFLAELIICVPFICISFCILRNGVSISLKEYLALPSTVEGVVIVPEVEPLTLPS